MTITRALSEAIGLLLRRAIAGRWSLADELPEADDQARGDFVTAALADYRRVGILPRAPAHFSATLESYREALQVLSMAHETPPSSGISTTAAVARRLFSERRRIAKRLSPMSRRHQRVICWRRRRR